MNVQAWRGAEVVSQPVCGVLENAWMGEAWMEKGQMRIMRIPNNTRESIDGKRAIRPYFTTTER